jgi:hypothetical protein
MTATKATYILTAAVLTFASVDAGSRQSAKARIEIVYQGQENGDYRLYLFGSGRALVCEEQAVQVVEQGDAIRPMVLECKHNTAAAKAANQ